MPLSKGLKAKYSTKGVALKKGRGRLIKGRKIAHPNPIGDSTDNFSENESLFSISSKESAFSFQGGDQKHDIFKENEELLDTVEQELKSLEEILNELSFEESEEVSNVDIFKMGNITEKGSKKTDPKGNQKSKSRALPDENSKKDSKSFLKLSKSKLPKDENIKSDPSDKRIIPATIPKETPKLSKNINDDGSNAWALDEILKEINAEDFEESNKRLAGIPPDSLDIFEDIKERLLEDYKKDRELTDEEKSRLREMIINAGNEILPGKKLHKILDSNSIFTATNSEMWKKILNQGTFPKEILENYKIPEEIFWPWMNDNDRERMKQIDSELTKLNEEKSAQLQTKEISTLLTECNENFGSGDEDEADESLFKSFLKDFDTDIEAQNPGSSAMVLQNDPKGSFAASPSFASESHSLEDLLRSNPKD